VYRHSGIKTATQKLCAFATAAVPEPLRSESASFAARQKSSPRNDPDWRGQPTQFKETSQADEALMTLRKSLQAPFCLTLIRRSRMATSCPEHVALTVDARLSVTSLEGLAR
jgi:hypothetical protein